MSIYLFTSFKSSGAACNGSHLNIYLWELFQIPSRISCFSTSSIWCLQAFISPRLYRYSAMSTAQIFCNITTAAQISAASTSQSGQDQPISSIFLKREGKVTSLKLGHLNLSIYTPFHFLLQDCLNTLAVQYQFTSPAIRDLSSHVLLFFQKAIYPLKKDIYSIQWIGFFGLKEVYQ